MYIAIFDLDGTITRHDTLVPYLFRYCLRRPWRLLRLWALPWHLLRYLVGGRDRGVLKEKLIVAVLRGLSRDDIAQLNRRFVPRLLRDGVYPEALKQLAAHKDHGDHLVLMSASPDLYVPAIAHALGMNETICTHVRWEGLCLKGELTTANRRGEEKVVCLEGLRQRYPDARVMAYGNSDSDLPHLKRCERGFLVNGNARARRQAAAAGVEIGWPA